MSTATSTTPGTGRQYKIRGLDCAEEVAILRREVGPLAGGEEHLAFDILKGRMTVAAAVSEEAVIQAVSRTGMRAEPWEDASRRDPRTESFWQRRGRVMMTAVSGLATLAGLAVHAFLSFVATFHSAGFIHPVPWAARIFYLLAIVAGGWFVAPKAWHALRRLRPDMNLLMTIAVAGALAIGDWLEAATVAFLFALSLALESWSVGRARRAVSALLDLAPPTARVRTPAGEEVVAASDVAVGSVFVVHAGERIPLDGRVVRGASEVDQAPITGESVPVSKQPGDEVFAGTINGDGTLEVESDRRAEDTTLARIIHMVEEAQARKAPSERWVERFARVYTPAVMALALAVFVVPPLAFGASWSDWLYRALVLLVIACPCALVISTPVTIVAALASAARHGVLVKGGLFLEIPARLEALAIDKTGTLTRGTPEVVEVAPMPGHSAQEVLQKAAALEARSNHPLARAIVARAREEGLEVLPADGVRILQGRGVEARVKEEDVWLGSSRYLLERGQENPEVRSRLAALAGTGRTAVVLGTGDHVCGVLAVADAVRPESRATVRALHEAGVRKIVMLTGDNRETAEAIAKETGIDEVRAELLPADKVQAVSELVASHGRVAMVGDGVNDAPALARATLGIAMGAAGSDAAIETADIALMSDDLTRLPWLVRHSRRTLAVLRQNIAFSLGLKAAFVILTFAGVASMWMAIAADTGASLLVIANGLRLLRE
ncbi:MAG TPA: heavy metal translocating P-type ATPase [Thermoanaerobaculia bacterium]|nr:heavy metal translocating P-type ATPase [Thermoanaerobaculia bacterium]